MTSAYWTYLIYILVFETLVLGGTGYAVFVLGHSGWWWLLAILIGGMAYSPRKWIHGVEK
jgi:hypothetical protein